MSISLKVIFQKNGGNILKRLLRAKRDSDVGSTSPHWLAFGKWSESENDFVLAHSLWGNPKVTHYFSSNGYTDEQIRVRLADEISNQKNFGVQYWPIFYLESGDFVGCCGLRPKAIEESDVNYSSTGVFEFGVHLRPGF